MLHLVFLPTGSHPQHPQLRVTGYESRLFRLLLFTFRILNSGLSSPRWVTEYESRLFWLRYSPSGSSLPYCQLCSWLGISGDCSVSFTHLQNSQLWIVIYQVVDRGWIETIPAAVTRVWRWRISLEDEQQHIGCSMVGKIKHRLHGLRYYFRWFCTGSNVQWVILWIINFR